MGTFTVVKVHEQPVTLTGAGVSANAVTLRDGTPVTLRDGTPVTLTTRP